MKKLILACLVSILFLTFCERKEQVIVFSPDNSLGFELINSDSLYYRVVYKRKEIIAPSAIGILLENGERLCGGKVKQVTTNKVNTEITPLYGKFNKLSDHYNEARVVFEDGYSLEIRAYNEGVAYRFITDREGNMIVRNEIAAFNVTDNPAVVYPETDNYTSWELKYIDYASVSSVPEGKKAITPVLFSREDGIKVVVAESDVRDYPGMYVRKQDSGFVADYAAYPDEVVLGSWGDFVSVVKTREDYIANTSGERAFPWRIIIATDDDKDLLTNELVYKLATPQVLSDVSWIKPGKAAWEWWHDAIVEDADIPSGMDNRNTALYKHYIDFAADNGLEYMMVDAGWSHIFDLSQVNLRVNIQEVIQYANQKGVGVFLWCVAVSLTDRADEFLAMMREWGAVGVKVDFFDRDDQVAMQWYETIASKAADHQLMVNLHGCSKPTGLQRTYPNIVNFEAVRGGECSKWDLTANPRHHVTFPFTRMLGGSLDYTPGAMRNRSMQTFKPIDPGLPLALGTRSHELAMFVVYDQYFAMLCDSPAEYRKYPDIMRFLSAVPVAFDNTIVLEAKVGECIVIAKQKGDEWYVGGMTDWTARDTQVDFSFLPNNKRYIAEIYSDGENASLYADQYVFNRSEIDSSAKIKLDMASGGGFVMRIYPAGE